MCAAIVILIPIVIVGGMILCYAGGKIGDCLAPEDKDVKI